MRKNSSFAIFIFLYLICHSWQLKASDLEVGIESLNITPALEDKIPLGGYGGMARRDWSLLLKLRPFGRHFKIAEGVEDELRSKAMYLYNVRTQQQLLFLSIDVIGVTRQMHRDLMNKLSKLGFQDKEVIISGTHTHSGPGGLAHNRLWELMAMDKFQPEFYEKFLDKIRMNVQRAMDKRRPAQLYQLNAQTNGLIRNRRGADRPLNPLANLLLAQDHTGEWLGGIVNFAVHGTWFGQNNLHFSSDVPGAIESHLEFWLHNLNRLSPQTYFTPIDSPTFLFINGAQGDISPNMHYQELGEQFVEQVAQQWDQKKRVSSGWSIRHHEVYLGKPKINVKKCVNKKRIPKRLNLSLRRWIASSTILTQVEFDDFIMLTWPGEPSTELGNLLNQQVFAQIDKPSWVMGLSNDHLAYFLSPEEFDQGGYEACTNFFGRKGGFKVIKAHLDILKK
jgi:hypothetical protein